MLARRTKPIRNLAIGLNSSENSKFHVRECIFAENRCLKMLLGNPTEASFVRVAKSLRIEREPPNIARSQYTKTKASKSSVSEIPKTFREYFA